MATVIGTMQSVGMAGWWISYSTTLLIAHAISPVLAITHTISPDSTITHTIG